MSIDNLGLNRGPATPPQKAPQATEQSAGTARFTAADSKTELNRSILQASLDVNIRSGNESLALVFKAAITGINEALAPELGDNAIERASESGLDVSPEATAERILSLTTGMFTAYQDANPDLQGKDLINRFIDVIGGGIEKGFNEARDILDGLKVLEGEIASNIDKTFELVQQGLQQFKEDFLGASGQSLAAETGKA